MSENQKYIEENLYRFKVRFVKKRLVEGLIVFVTTIILVYLAISGLEAVGRFNSWIRALLLLGFLSTGFMLLFIRVGRPLLQLLKAEYAIENEEAARTIGDHFPGLSDKLLNYIQLSSSSFSSNALASASLDQRAGEMQAFSFDDAINFEKERKRIYRWVLPLIVLLGSILLFFPRSFVGSTERIINFSKPYVPEAPFQFNLEESLLAFRNEDFVLKTSLTGEAVPDEAWFVADGKRIKMTSAGFGNFELAFPNIETSKNFKIEAAGYKSRTSMIKVVDRPSLTRFGIELNYPAHINKRSESFENMGNLVIPEGTEVNWTIDSRFTDEVHLSFTDDTITLYPENKKFIHSRQVLADIGYKIELKNEFGRQEGSILYDIKVVKDDYPEIDVQMAADSSLFSYVVFAGRISDDHGLSSLRLYYTKNGDAEKRVNVAIDRSSKSQSVFYQWSLDSLKITAGDQLDFYLKVTDNDAVNNYKSVKSKLFRFNVPDKEEQKLMLDESRNSTKEQISDAADEAKELKENIDDLVEQLRGKKELSWQEKQMLENLVEQKQELEKQIEELQQENQMLNEQQQQLEDPSEEMMQKQEQLQDLLDELLDEETRELYEQLQEMLEKYENNEAVQEMLQKIQNKELNLEQELERALEFFKEVQFEQKLDEATQELEQIIEEQEELTEKTEQESQPSDSLASDQGKLNEKFKDFQEQLRDAKEMNQDLKRPNSMEDTSGEEQEVNENQNSSKENLQNNERNKSKQSQQNATQKMKEIGKKLENMQTSMQMQQMQEDLGDLQAILNNLIELSFDQENLMKDFKTVKPSDPSFITLSQEQLALKDDSKIINDSLLALSSRVMAIASFVTRELNEMNKNMDASIEAIRERKRSEASVNQQLTMTSANNLALMLDNVMQQMQENMSMSMGKGQQQGEQQLPGLSEMQQKLNEQIRELSQSGKSGRELSEELAKLAAEQEKIRKALEEAEEKYGNEPGQTENLRRQMERSELDLVNKNLSRQLLRRQEQIMTRMLEAEKSMRERELDSKREAKSATQYDKMLPKAFEDYMKQREKEIELLKTVPPRLVPFFKIEVGEYFDRIKQTENNTNN